MAVIPPTFGAGGANLSPGGNGTPSLATALRDVAADLGTLKGSAPAAWTPPPALAAFTDPPTAGEMATLRAAVNSLIVRVSALHTLHAQDVARTDATLVTTAL